MSLAAPLLWIAQLVNRTDQSVHDLTIRGPIPGRLGAPRWMGFYRSSLSFQLTFHQTLNPPLSISLPLDASPLSHAHLVLLSCRHHQHHGCWYSCAAFTAAVTVWYWCGAASWPLLTAALTLPISLFSRLLHHIEHCCAIQSFLAHCYGMRFVLLSGSKLQIMIMTTLFQEWQGLSNYCPSWI